MLVFAPPGSGKSTWVATRPGWLDQDMLYAHLHDETWHEKPHSPTEEREHYAAIDRRLETDRHTLNIVGCLFWEAVPDAVVMPPEGRHREMVAQRPDLEWGGWSRSAGCAGQRYILIATALIYRGCLLC